MNLSQANRLSENGFLRQAQNMDRIADLFSVVPNPMVLVDTQGTIVLANERVCSLFGYKEGALAGKLVAELIPKRYRDTDAKHLEAYFRAPREKEMGIGMELIACHADGSEFPIEINLNPYGTADAVYTLASLRAITERKATEIRIRHLNRILTMQSHIHALIVRVHDREELFREACRIAVEAGAFAMAWIGLLDPDGSKVRVVASFGERAEEYLKDIEVEAPILQGPAGVVVREDRPVWIQDYQHSPLTEPWHERNERFGWSSLAVLPLHRAGVPIGALALYAGEIGAFDEEEEAQLAELATNLSFAIDHIEKERKLNYLAYYDVLTGLPNRTLFLNRVTHYLRSAVSGRHKLAIFLLDLDRFKNINDSLGQLAGDKLLKQVAKWLTREAGDANLLARLDADHFAVVIPEIKQEDDVALLVERWMKALRDHPFGVKTATFRISAKVGISMYPEDGANAATLFKHAEAALKQAKASRNRYLFHTPEMTEMMAGKFVLENQLRQALDKHEFTLHYQPKVNMVTGELTGVEALIRWNDPRTGLVPPGRFTPMLEETGLIYEVGRWALGQAIEDYLRWRRAGLPAVRIAVNVSPLQLRNRHFIGDIEWAIGDCKDAADGLELEITEGLIMEDVEYSIATLRAIRAMGVSIAIDDFGTGFSSLSYLSKLPLDTLKIDRSFVIDLTEAPEGLAQVSTIINLAHSLSLKVVAEGVETPEQARLLRMLGCNEMQGFFLSKALPSEIFEARYLAPHRAG
jgi:diguanylate cyclase (GGDEF)-like protein/PAS domain S-box-containing protein